MSKLKKKLKMVADLNKDLFDKIGGGMPPSIMIFKGNMVLFIVINEMDGVQQKYEAGFIAQVTAHLLGDVDAIAYSSECWVLGISPDEYPDLFEKFGNDPNKVQEELIRPYGEISKHPDRKEMIMSIVDDGENEMTAMTAVIRDMHGKMHSLQPDLKGATAMPSDNDPFHRFNGLLSKSRRMSEVIELMQAGADLAFPEHSDDDFERKTLGYIAKELKVEIDVDRILVNARGAVEQIGLGGGKYTIH